MKNWTRQRNRIDREGPLAESAPPYNRGMQHNLNGGRPNVAKAECTEANL
jgi:hypothetical protein